MTNKQMVSWFKCPTIQKQYQEETQPPRWPSIHQHHHLWKSSSFQCASLAVPLLLKLNTTYQTLLIETLCYHITFNSTLLQTKIAFAFDPLYQMFSLSSPQWHLISWVTKNHSQLKLLFPHAYAVFNICCIIVLGSWVWSLWLVSYTVFLLN